jgi:hypothetical protein
MKPRKLKKMLKKWMAMRPITRRERRRLFRHANHIHRQMGQPPIRRMPDGRVSLLELP